MFTKVNHSVVISKKLFKSDILFQLYLICVQNERKKRISIEEINQILILLLLEEKEILNTKEIIYNYFLNKYINDEIPDTIIPDSFDGYELSFSNNENNYMNIEINKDEIEYIFKDLKTCETGIINYMFGYLDTLIIMDSKNIYLFRKNNKDMNWFLYYSMENEKCEIKKDVGENEQFKERSTERVTNTTRALKKSAISSSNQLKYEDYERVFNITDGKKTFQIATPFYNEYKKLKEKMK